MGFSSLASRVNISSQSSSRNGRQIDRFIVHHAASTSTDVVVGMMVSGSREVSANYVVGDQIVGVVPEEVRAWTSASADWDGRAVTVETINDSTNGWTVSDRTFDNLARLIADVARRHGFAITDNTVLTHQELYTRYGASYATSCPGDLQRRKGELLALANTYLAGGEPEPETDSEEEEMKLQIMQAQGTAEVYAVSRLTGKKWHVPNMDYLKLLRGRGIVTDDVMVVPQNEFDFYLALWETVGAADSSVEGKLDKIAAQLIPA